MSATPSAPPRIDAARAFDATHAEGYDRRTESLRIFKDALHLLLQVRFARLPADARILVAGAGTGAEVRFLAPLFPGWRFTLVDPSAAMLDVARRHAETEGFAARCTFHAGLVSSTPVEGHDGAVSVLVSHFLTEASARQAYFEDIARRSKPGGLLFNADLCAERDAPGFDALMDLWLGITDPSGIPTAHAGSGFRSVFGRDVAVHGPIEVEAMMVRAGFDPPVQCFQSALIRGWVATRSQA